MRKVLLVRFSAMGDVALLVPVVKSFVTANPEIELTIVTRPKFAPLFQGMERVIVFSADVEKIYTGIFGMLTLCKRLLQDGPYEFVIDMHDHMRTKILRFFFKLFGARVVVFEKGRGEKKLFIKKAKDAPLTLPHTVERYRLAFEQAGFSFPVLEPPYFEQKESRRIVANWIGFKDSDSKLKWVGIAPFAMHKSKIWPIENYKLLFELLIAKETSNIKFLLFGGGEHELLFFDSLKNQFPLHVQVIAGKLQLRQEIEIMQCLDIMLCVDSSNMHMAALANVPLLSIWGGTHTDLGFGPFKKGKESIIEMNRNELPCRPCSVYGSKTCYIGNFPCLSQITPSSVFERIVRVI
jgi:ADP-heptose:LPS heptosyltransferase